MTKTTIMTVGGSRHPNLSAFDLSWPEVEGLYAEHEELAEQAGKVRLELADLESALKVAEQSLPHRRAEAARSGKSVDTKHIEKLRGEIEKLRASLEDVEGAAKLVEADIQAALEENRGDYLEQIEQKRMQAAGRAQKLRAELAAETWWFEATDRLTSYLTREYITGGKKFMGIGPRPEVPANVKADV